MKCPKCQSENPETSRFCAECGTQLGIYEQNAPQDVRPEVTATLQTPIKELTTGSTFAGRYQIIEELDKGGMGRVYKVYDPKIRENVRGDHGHGQVLPMARPCAGRPGDRSRSAYSLAVISPSAEGIS